MQRDTEYMYASAKIRAAEGKDTAAHRLERMLECHTTEQLYRTVLEAGFLAEERNAPPDLDTLLDAALEEAVSLVRTSTPEPEIYDFLLYKYDCSNIKVALKSTILGLAYPELYFPWGTFSTERLAERLAEGDTDGLPVNMAKAVGEAGILFAAAGEGRDIDFLLDRACFADMADNTAKYGVPLFRAYTAARADTVNILSAVRLASRGTKEGAFGIFCRAFVPGGGLPVTVFGGEGQGCFWYDGIAERMDPGELKDIVTSLASEGENARPEMVFDAYLQRNMEQNRYVPFGGHVPALFLLRRETEIRTCRIIASGIASGKQGSALRERIRTVYA